MLYITEQLAIAEQELMFTATRSSGPGGQHVNKVSSRITLRFDVTASLSLSEAQKHRLLTRLATRVGKDGVLRVSSQKHRSQMANRTAAIERFVALLQDALAPAPRRKKTRLPAAAKRRRRDEKTRRSLVKQQRVQRGEWEP